jgi:hypothetical protein
MSPALGRAGARAIRVVLWASVFLGSAGIGAYVAAHSELFPPEVESAAATTDLPTASASTPTPSDPSWSGMIRSVSYHDLYVGGQCRTDWLTKIDFDALDNGRIVGAGTARLQGPRECTFPNAQINAETIEVSVEGSWDGGGFHLRLRDGDRSPRGTADYGGFAPTVFDDGREAVMDVELASETAASATIQMERVDDQGRGRYRSTNRVSLDLEA